MLMNYDAKAVAEILGVVFFPNIPGENAGGEKARVRRSARRGVMPRADEGAAPGAAEIRPASVPTQRLIERAVEQGLPRNSLRHVAAWLAGDDAGKIASLEWGVVPKTTLDRRATQLSPQESERTERVARLAAHSCRALGTVAEARDFMLAPHPELDGRSPLEASRTDLGTRRAEQILNALEYGLAL